MCFHSYPQASFPCIANNTVRFRWATCQLDVPAKCTNLFKLHATLRTLPKTLAETYERILLSIDPDNRADALKMLQWLVFSARPLTVKEMTEICAIDRSKQVPRFEPDQRLRDPRDILDLCSCPITVSYSLLEEDGRSDIDSQAPDGQNGILSLAHLSVKEHLTSAYINNSDASYPQLNKKLVDTDIAQDCLAYLLHFETIHCLHHYNSSSPPLARYAAEYWIVHARSDDGSIKDGVQLLIKQFFLSHNAIFPHWLAVKDYFLEAVIEGTPRPLFYASYLGLDDVVH